MILSLIFIFILLLLISAFFSGSETALFSLSRARILSWTENGSPSERRAAELIGPSYGRTLIVLVLGNMFVNSALSMTGDEIVTSLNINPLISTLISIIMSVILLLLIGEITPKTFAIIYTEGISRRVAGIIYYMRTLFYPLIFILERIFSVILDLLGRRESAPLNHEEYSSYLDMACSVGAFSGDETELMSDVFTLRELKVNAVMRGRVDLITVKKGDSHRRIASLIRKKREFFYPVRGNNIDDSKMFLSARDFFMLPRERRSSWEDEATFDALFIPENATLTKALSMMKHHSVPAALVVDEYGGVTGMIKLNDIYEELLGDVKSEFERPDWQIKRLAENRWICSGNIPLQDIEELTGIDIEGVVANTLNGLFCEISGKIPAEGDSIVYQRFYIKALRVDSNRIVEAELSLKL